MTFFFVVKWAKILTQYSVGYVCKCVLITVPRLHVLTFTEDLSTET